MSAAIKKLAVIGAGQMGTGIALVAAHVAKISVVVVDSNRAAMQKSESFARSWFNSQVSKGKLKPHDAELALSRMSFEDQLQVVSDCDFVIEAVTESFQVKKSILSKCDELAPEHTILASNTSSISISRLGGATKRPDRVIGMHFMNPVPVMKLVEIIGGIATSEITLNSTLALSKQMKKETTLSKDYPGFIANRLLMPYINEAVFVLSEGIASAEDIDKTMKLGTNVPMGPLQLADFIGLDTCLSIMEVLHRDIGDSKYRPCPLLANYVASGWLGKKTGKGFYEYESNKSKI